MLRQATTFALVSLLASPAAPAHAQETFNRHQVVLDAQSKLLSWATPQERAYDRVMRLAWDFLLKTVPVEPNGLKLTSRIVVLISTSCAANTGCTIPLGFSPCWRIPRRLTTRTPVIDALWRWSRTCWITSSPMVRRPQTGRGPESPMQAQTPEPPSIAALMTFCMTRRIRGGAMATASSSRIRSANWASAISFDLGGAECFVFGRRGHLSDF